MSTSEPGARGGSRMRRKNFYLIASWVAAPLLAAVVFFTDGMGAASMLMAALALLVAVGLSTAWFVSLDEVAQRAHYEAWFWGGMTGLMALPLSVLVVGVFGATRSGVVETVLRQVLRAPALSDALVAGVFFALTPMVVGYGVWWVAFWLRNR